MFFVKQKTAYEVRISDGSSDVCSSDLLDDQGEVRVIEKMISTWLSNGALRTVERPNDKREVVEYVEVGQWAIVEGRRSSPSCRPCRTPPPATPGNPGKPTPPGVL